MILISNLRDINFQYDEETEHFQRFDIGSTKKIFNNKNEILKINILYLQKETCVEVHLKNNFSLFFYKGELVLISQIKTLPNNEDIEKSKRLLDSMGVICKYFMEIKNGKKDQFD